MGEGPSNRSKYEGENEADYWETKIYRSEAQIMRESHVDLYFVS
jgi:hypothetical protein